MHQPTSFSDGTADVKEGNLMKEKSLWLFLSSVVSSMLALAACATPTTSGPAATQTQTSSITPATQSAAASSEQPKYGGTLNVISLLDIGVFDPVATGQFIGPTGPLTNEQYVAEDWTTGSAGTGGIDWVPNTGPAPNTCDACYWLRVGRCQSSAG